MTAESLTATTTTQDPFAPASVIYTSKDTTIVVAKGTRSVRWKPALNAFALMFENRIFPNNK